MTHTIAIYLFDQVEVLDFAGPFEVFCTAARMYERTQAVGAPGLFTVFTVAQDNRPRLGRGGLQVQPQFHFGNHPAIDVLIVPGGVVTAELDNPAVIEWIGRTAQRAGLTASVCTGAFVLAKAGLLDGKPVTTHWEDIADLAAAFPALQVKSGVRWVDAGATVTSAGISAGIDMSLYLVARLAGRELAIRTARQMEFDWTCPEGV